MCESKHDHQDVDKIFQGLSSLLEFSGILRDSNDNFSDDADRCLDPWVRLSENLKEFMVSFEKFRKIVPQNSMDAVNEDTEIFATRNELLLGIENTMHEARLSIVSLSTMLKKAIPLQLNACKELESISRTNMESQLSVRLLPMAKSLAGAIRQQKLTWLHCVHLIEDSFQQIFGAPSNSKMATDNLKLVYKKLNRRCVNPDHSPWKETFLLLESIAAGDGVRELRRMRLSTCNESQDATPFDLALQNLHSNKQGLQRFSNSSCASQQLEHILSECFEERLGNQDNPSKTLSILIVGPEGSGKTYLLNEIERKSLSAGLEIEIVHPEVPFDLIGPTVGAAEDMLISMICYAKTQERNCVLLLDDIDIICGQAESFSSLKEDSSIERQQSHSTARLRYLFFSLLDIIQGQYYGDRNGKMILICTSKKNFGKEIDRFDKILPLLPPNKDERRRIISNFVDIGSPIDDLVEYTIGLSRAELTHHCRQVLISIHSHTRGHSTTKDFALYLKEKLQSSTPESLKHGVNDDFVDMKVLTARDLQQLYPIKNPKTPLGDLPLFGDNAKKSWEELRRLIVLPLCQGPVIDKILYNRGGICSKKAFVGGVLLAAPPGTGKSTLAYFCAAVASSLDQSIKLIDVSCTSLIHKEVGGSERALHRFFQKVRSAMPCIVVMDGIESIAAVRGNDNTTEGTMDRVLSTLLTELDGVENEISTDRAVGCMAIIGITHNPLWVDPALCRPGRLERTIWLGNPDFEGRKRILLRELQDVEYRPDDYRELLTINDLAMKIASITNGYTGAELNAICNESKILAFNKQNDFIIPQMVFDAMNAKPPNL